MSVTVKSELEVDTKSKIMEPCRSDITKLELEDDEIEDTKQKGPSINDVAIFSLVFLPLSTPHPPCHHFFTRACALQNKYSPSQSAPTILIYQVNLKFF